VLFAARAEPRDCGERREPLQYDQVADQGGDARGQPRARPLVQGRPVRVVLRLPGRVGPFFTGPGPLYPAAVIGISVGNWLRQ